ncbi:MAG: hypothetical protein WBL19_01310 [Minisyncoccia bacterium]
MSETFFEITGGPTRDTMIRSLALWNEDRPVPFTLTVKGEQVPHLSLTVELYRIGPEPGDHRYEVWLVTLFDDQSRLGATRLEGYYNSSRRTGRLRLVKA